MSNEFIAEGRIVWGHPGKGQKAVNMQTKQPKLNKHNQEYEEWAFGIAVPKDKFNASCWPAMHAAAAQFVPNPPADFSWKFKDGDTAVDANGNPFNQMEGRAGCVILAVKTSAFAPPLFKHDGREYVQITADEIKCGDYVAVGCTAEFNGSNGIYVNPNAVTLIGYGEEIRTSSTDPNQVFAGYTPQLPPGATAQPTMGSAPMPAAMTGQQPPAAQPAPMPHTPAPQGQLPPPAHGFVANAGQQPPAAQPAPMPHTPAPQAAGVGVPTTHGATPPAAAPIGGIPAGAPPF